MRVDWELKKLGDVCEIYQPRTISTKEMIADGKYLVYGANGVIGRYNKYNHEEAQLLITCRGATCGSINVSEPRSWINGNAMVIKPKVENLNIKFIEYIFRGGININNVVSGSAQPQITRQSLSPVIINYPKLISEQQRIVEILDEAFAAIDKAKENAQKNLQNAKELFESYLQSVFSNPGDDWEEKRLPDISDNFDNLRIPITKHLRKVGKYPYYGASGIVDYVNDYIFEGNFLLISEDGANLLARTYPIAFSINGRNWVNNHAHVLKFHNLITQKFTEYYLNNINLDSFISGMAQPKLNQAKLNSIPIPLPIINKQEELLQKFDYINDYTCNIIDNCTKKISSLEELKKSILQKAFNGELTSTKELEEAI